MNITTKRGINWHYEISGQGEPVLLIHGFAGSSRWWHRQKAFLECHNQVLTLDLPGHGTSSWQPVSLLDMAVDIRQILTELHLSQINVVASSFGGLLALELYRLMPDQISRLSFVGSLAKFARSESYPAGLDIPKIHKMSQQFDRDYGLILDVFFRSLFSMKERESKEFEDLKTLRAQEPLPQVVALRLFLEILEKTDLRDRLSSVVCPVQWISGTEDYICPVSVMEWIQEHMPNARLDFIDGCGHLPFLTKHREYNEYLENFLIN